MLIGEINKSFYYDDDHLSTYGSLKLEEINFEIQIRHFGDSINFYLLLIAITLRLSLNFIKF